MTNNKFKLPRNIVIGIIYKNFEYSGFHKVANKWINFYVKTENASKKIY
jgi:hypothetical protein